MKVNGWKLFSSVILSFFFLLRRRSLRADQKSQVVDDWWLLKIFFQEVRRPFTVLKINRVDTKIYKKAKGLLKGDRLASPLNP